MEKDPGYEKSWAISSIRISIAVAAVGRRSPMFRSIRHPMDY
jgi:hypothetical protein